MYFSNKRNGRGFNVGIDNVSKVVNILFEGLDVISYDYDNQAKMLVVISTQRLSQGMLDARREACKLTYKSGNVVKPYVMAELS